MENPGDRELEYQRKLPTPDYQPPRVERVVTSVELEREVLYAGLIGTPI